MRIFLSHSFTLLIAGSVCSVGFLGMPRLAAQAPVADSKPQPDVLILVDDERVVGHFVGSNGASVSLVASIQPATQPSGEPSGRPRSPPDLAA